MNKLSFLLALTALTGLSHANVKSDIEASNRKIEKAAMAKDIKGTESAMKEAMTSDFQYKQGGETQDLKMYIGNFVASIKMMEKITSHSTRFLSLKETGSKATAQIEKTMAGKMTGPDKKSHAINWTGRFTEDYRKVGGKWKTCAVKAGPQKFLMDGKPVKM